MYSGMGLLSYLKERLSHLTTIGKQFVVMKLISSGDKHGIPEGVEAIIF